MPAVFNSIESFQLKQLEKLLFSNIFDCDLTSLNLSLLKGIFQLELRGTIVFIVSGRSRRRKSTKIV